MRKKVHVYYSGSVQGVGFRFTTREIARELDVCGWVKNLSDGKVELVAEAEEVKLNNFLSQINKCFSAYIKNADIEWFAFTGDYWDFSIER